MSCRAQRARACGPSSGACPQRLGGRLNRRDTIVGLLALGAASSSQPVLAQSRETVRRLATLNWSNPNADKAGRENLLRELEKLGWIVSRNLIINALYANGEDARMDDLAAKLVALKPDVIIAGNAPGALALQRATRTIPIVFSGVTDPVGLGLIKSVSRPGGNITGVAGLSGYEIAAKRMQLLKELLPRANLLAILFNPQEPENLTLRNEYSRLAPQFGLRLLDVSARSPTDLDAALAELQRARPDTVIVFGNGVTFTHRKAICERLAAAKIPSMSGYTQIVEAGCLFGYMSLIGDFYGEIARYVDRILRGANPADLPVTQPMRFELVFNAKTARTLGLVIPQTLLMRADRVIE